MNVKWVELIMVPVILTVPIQRAPIYVHVMLGITRLEYYVQVFL